ncbi:MAG TPA: hypothetical protein VLR26_05490 [Frankiaceae bacterium]|nr:hypothetical protein [Frankiaceae bacterium]
MTGLAIAGHPTRRLPPAVLVGTIVAFGCLVPLVVVDGIPAGRRRLIWRPALGCTPDAVGLTRAG